MGDGGGERSGRRCACPGRRCACRDPATSARRRSRCFSSPVRLLLSPRGSCRHTPATDTFPQVTDGLLPEAPPPRSPERVLALAAA
ncbi:hypothetical protein STXM2123_5097 [Streptomyces sp. F-3]|nr:hypothetical protein STXM2123_5097 [Streptomyces sp. F-3]